MEMSNLRSYTKKPTVVEKILGKKLKLKHVICEIVLHTALLAEPSTSEGWANANSILYPILSE